MLRSGILRVFLYLLMKRNIFIQVKAAFLLIVFSLNMIIGFACAIGINMWFNTGHHEKADIIAHEGSHHHDEADKDHKSKDSKDNCCNDHVIKFSRVDKSFPQSFAGLNAIFFITLIFSFYNIDVLHTSKGSASIKYFVRSHHPPIPDIRVAIHSFQI
jgi:ABC-type nickel/cobalt efflux system permease component RcnA